MYTPLACLRPAAFCAVLGLVLGPGAASAGAEGGLLGSLRDVVRTPSIDSGSGSSSESCDSSHRKKAHFCDYDDCDDCNDSLSSGLTMMGVMFTGVAVTSPWWGPHMALGDDFSDGGYFAPYPYHCHSGHIMVGPRNMSSWPCLDDVDLGSDCLPLDFWPSRPRTWSARLSGEYADRFCDDVSRIGGRLLFTTASRFGLDTEMGRLEERLPAGGVDQLWIGDCNLVFRFAQSERVQFRTGLGFNWLDDPAATDFGFNFTYGADFFPHRPWVVSTAIDWGTLGEAELFRFRSTIGLLVNRVEVYTGYEYLDIDTVQLNSLMAGLRIWF